MEIFSLLMDNPLIGLLLLGSIAVVIGLHEAAHAYTANWLGDSTPKSQKRLTLNPLKHLDPIGTLLIIFAGIGWGKPVQFNPFNLKNPKTDAAIIAFAGPLSNILMAIVAAALFYLDLGFVINTFLKFFAVLNLNLAIFNLIPIDPLDGFKVVGGLLPPFWARKWYETQSYGIWVLFLLLLTGTTTILVTIPSQFLYNLLF